MIDRKYAISVKFKSHLHNWLTVQAAACDALVVLRLYLMVSSAKGYLKIMSPIVVRLLGVWNCMFCDGK